MKFIRTFYPYNKRNIRILGRMRTSNTLCFDVIYLYMQISNLPGGREEEEEEEKRGGHRGQVRCEDMYQG